MSSKYRRKNIYNMFKIVKRRKEKEILSNINMIRFYINGDIADMDV